MTVNSSANRSASVSKCPPSPVAPMMSSTGGPLPRSSWYSFVPLTATLGIAGTLHAGYAPKRQAGRSHRGLRCGLEPVVRTATRAPTWDRATGWPRWQYADMTSGRVRALRYGSGGSWGPTPNGLVALGDHLRSTTGAALASRHGCLASAGLPMTRCGSSLGLVSVLGQAQPSRYRAGPMTSVVSARGGSAMNRQQQTGLTAGFDARESER
jgi:hypothetical protein